MRHATTLLTTALLAGLALCACGGHDEAPHPAPHETARPANPCLAAMAAFTQAASHVSCTADSDCAPAPGMTVAGAIHGCPGGVRADSAAALRAAATDVQSRGCAEITPTSPLECNGRAGTIHCIHARCQATY